MSSLRQRLNVCRTDNGVERLRAANLDEGEDDGNEHRDYDCVDGNRRASDVVDF